MKTNNREFIKLKYMTIIILLLFIVVYIVGLSRDIMFISGIFLIGSLYFVFYQTVSHLYHEMREVIAYASDDQQAIIKDGDLGLLYDEMVRLKREHQLMKMLFSKKRIHFDKQLKIFVIS